MPQRAQTTATRVEPCDAAGVARGALAALDAAALTSPGARRLGVDAAVAADAEVFADAVVVALGAQGRTALRVSAEGYLRPRSLRLEHGRHDPDAGYEGWYDVDALLREVLDPLGPGGSGAWLPALWDASRDRATRLPRRHAPDGAVLVLTGPFLLRWELVGALDAVVHLQTSPAALRRRLPEADMDRVVGAWARYLSEADPAPRADVVVRCEDPRHPAVVLPPPPDGA